jgi:hypothetical protein
MLRSRSDVDWSKRLAPPDLGYLVQRIDGEGWYPMETFERMGVAILTEIADGSLESARMFGRASIDWLCQSYGNLVAPGDPRDSIMRFQVLRRSFFDYPALALGAVADGEASVLVCYAMGPVAEEAACWQTLGFFERLLEVAGAKEVKAWFGSRGWKGDLFTTIELRWEQEPIGSGGR